MCAGFALHLRPLIHLFQSSLLCTFRIHLSFETFSRCLARCLHAASLHRPAGSTANSCTVNRAFRRFVPPLLLFRGPYLGHATIAAIKRPVDVVQRQQSIRAVVRQRRCIGQHRPDGRLWRHAVTVQRRHSVCTVEAPLLDFRATLLSALHALPAHCACGIASKRRTVVDKKLSS